MTIIVHRADSREEIDRSSSTAVARARLWIAVTSDVVAEANALVMDVVLFPATVGLTLAMFLLVVVRIAGC